MNELLTENEGKRLNLRLPWLVCLAMFVVWQMGVMLFSGETLSLGGKTPIPFAMDSNILTAVVAAGYILSIAFLLFFGRHSVLSARAALAVAFVSALALYLPVPPEILMGLFYLQAFCCVFLIGVVISAIVNLFTEETEIKDVIVILIVSGGLIAVLQNDVIPITFGVMQGLTVFMLAALLFFFCKLPAKVWPRYVKKTDRIVMPKHLIAGLMGMVGFSAFITLFGSAVAESVPHGVSVYYAAYALCGVILAVLWKVFHIVPLKSASVMVTVGAFGFVLAIASLYVPVLALPVCALLAAGGAVCAMSSYFGIVMAKRYPSRFIVPALPGIALVAVLIQSVLLESLRGNLTGLYVVYLVIAVGMMIVYLKFEPYLLWSFFGKTLTVASAPSAETEHTQTPPDDDSQSSAERLLNLQLQAFDTLGVGEVTVLNHMLGGQTTKEISLETTYPESTVKTYRKRIYSKLQVHNTLQLAALAEKRLRRDKETD